jgi:ammonium transporter, Amt family|tara:strand:- start:314 stop:1516 length:1203 start_codon:yes stop_codon:yes gene_type:complete
MIGADTSWILTSTALVLIMTLPGLALFYGGLVRSSNILSVLIQCFAIACLASIVWLVAGYSIAFSGEGAYIGDLKKVFLRGVGTETALGNLPENVFFMFQMTFAVITPALIVGAYVERIKFSAVLWISALWLLLVYAPVTHWIWGGGWLAQMGVQDFAGGLVVHLNCGMAALVIAKMLGSRKGFPNDVKPPHSPVLVFVGAAMLWVGWFGFNGGSALAADGAAGMAITVTHISAATAALTWMTIEWISHGKPTLVGIATGAIAGLATITPASGFVGPVGALIIGVLAGFICYKMCGIIKNKWKIDDALDVMAVHGIGGVLGILLTAPLGSLAFGGLGLSEKTIGEQFITQLIGVIAVGLWCLVATWLITLLVKKTIGLRVTEDEEIEGLDTSVHGEKGYN